MVRYRKALLGVSAIVIVVIVISLFQVPLSPLRYEVSVELHMIVEHYDANGNLVSRTIHAMTIVNQGKDWMEDQLADSPSTDPAKWIAVSNDETAVSEAWTVLPNEITTGGLARSAGTYVSTGTGAWNATKTFSITATISCCLYGVYSASTGNALVAAEQQGAGNRKNTNSGDTLKVTVQGSVG